mgnify:CR=1 FL=1
MLTVQQSQPTGQAFRLTRNNRDPMSWPHFAKQAWIDGVIRHFEFVMHVLTARGWVPVRDGDWIGVA